MKDCKGNEAFLDWLEYCDRREQKVREPQKKQEIPWEVWTPWGPSEGEVLF